MNRFLTVVVLTVLLAALAGCGPAKPPTVSAVQGNKVIAALKDLSSFYEKKNLSGFMSNISDEFKERKELNSSVAAVFSQYDAVHFTVQYAKMIITVEQKTVSRASFNWESGWQTAQGSMLKNSGRATFVFDSKDGKLLAIDGKNPFIPQAIQAHGDQF